VSRLYFTVPQTPLGLQATIETHNPFYVNSDAVLTTQCSHGVDPYLYIYFLPVQQINIIATRASSKLQPQYFQPFDEYIKSITTIPANIHSLSIKTNIPMEQVPHQHGQALGQPVQTSVHRADSSHEQHYADGMQDRLPDMRPESQHVRRAGSNPNRKVSVYEDVIFTHAEDRPSWAARIDGDTQPAQLSQYAPTPHANQSTYPLELASSHDSDFGWDEDTLEDHAQRTHSHWSTQSICSSDDTLTSPDLTNSTKSALTAANLHLNEHLEAQFAPPLSPHDSSLSPARIRYINRYGHVQPDENTFNTQYRSAHELIPVGRRFQSHARGNRDSMSFIEGGKLDNNVDQLLLHNVERQHEGISGYFRQLARRARAWMRW
jgi:hypothetical protein